jgi:hypothetical protein
MTLTTEGGFVYEPINLDISEGLLEGYTYATGGLADNSLFVRNIPPGFMIRGDNQFGWKLDVRTMHYGYMVAESQQIFTLQAPEVLIYCFSPSGEQISQKEEGFSLSVDLNLTPITYPLVQVDNGFQNILKSEITLEKGRVQFTNVERSHIVWEDVGIESDVMFLYYKYANASQGYDALEFFIGYVVGDDGIARHLGCPSNCVSSTGLQANITGLAAGPGQTVEGVFAFTISNEVSNLKLVFESVQQVFNVPIE